jgi:hypothetical protein
VRLHSHWIARVLYSTPVLDPLAGVAAAQHERSTGLG